MSRRHNRTEAYPEPEAGTEDLLHPEVAWTDPIGPAYPGLQWWEWQTAFAATTLRIVQTVWKRRGSKLYAAQRNHVLRDDLQSWLMVEAQALANKYLPDPWHPDPEDRWGGYLYSVLTDAARWHFEKVVGSVDRHTRAEAVRIHQEGGVVSTDFLDELEREEGTRSERHALHGIDLMQRDPLRVVIHLEQLAREYGDIERYLRAHGTYGTVTRIPAGGVCVINLCTKTATARGLCRQHYMAEREVQLPPGCNVPGCSATHRAHGMCDRHLKQYVNGTLPADLREHYEAEPRPRGYRAAAS